MSFYYKSASGYTAKFRVGYSPNRTVVHLKDLITTNSGEWALYEAYLPAETQYVVICCLGESVLLYVDDFSFTAVSNIDLANNADNTSTITSHNRENVTVTLKDRTIYRDGDWNTLCLPFNVSSFAGTPLIKATVKTLESSSFNDGTLTLNFSEDLTAIEAGKPYIVKWADAAALQIKTVDDWNAFAAAVAGGKSFAGKTVMLMDYVGSESDPITTMVGTTEHPFCGTFEGNCQRMYVNIDGESGEAVAPFRYINGATIQNLVIWGPVKGGNYSAGLVGKALGGTNSIHNVLVQTNVETSSDHVGGIIGHGSSSATTLRDCLFCGTILAPSSQHLGMLYGWGNAGGTHTIINCVADGDYQDSSTNGSYTKLMWTDGGSTTITNCWRSTTATNQGNYFDSASESGKNTAIAALGDYWTLDPQR